MNHLKMEAFDIVGIAIKTTNTNNQAASDIPKLWEKFMGEGILEKIPNKVDNVVYSMYTDYEGDYTTPYTTIIGCKVKNIDQLPDGMEARHVQASDYQKFTVNGDLNQGIIINQWLKIWERSDLNRTYQADFEVYGEKAMNPANAEVDIFISIH